MHLIHLIVNYQIQQFDVNWTLFLTKLANKQREMYTRNTK